MSVEVTHHSLLHRFEARADGRVVGVAEYLLDGDVITFTHTQVDPDQEGRGVGSTLVRGALDDARARGLTVRPRCSFVAAYIDRHQEYADLLG